MKNLQIAVILVQHAIGSSRGFCAKDVEEDKRMGGRRLRA